MVVHRNMPLSADNMPRGWTLTQDTSAQTAGGVKKPLPSETPPQVSAPVEDGNRITIPAECIRPRATARQYKCPEHPQAQCAFLKLPGELRNKIYELVAGPRRIIVVQPASKTLSLMRPSLRLTCQKFHHEVGEIVFPDTTLFFPQGTFEPKTVRIVRKMLRPMLHRIQRIKVTRRVRRSDPCVALAWQRFEICYDPQNQNPVKISPKGDGNEKKTIGIQSDNPAKFLTYGLMGMRPTTEMCDCQIRVMAEEHGKDVLGAIEEYALRLYDDEHRDRARRTHALTGLEGVETGVCGECGTLRAVD